ncbi:MAG: phenylacetate--CoA ligase family protein, partial [Actinobacteria bacterium]|nr:phenylacetate--CoA ligase family protein [Actinomycetota bacterium]
GAESDDMFVIRGKNVYPSAIESVVRGTPELGTEYKIVIDRDERGLDNVTVVVEPKGDGVDVEDIPAMLREKFRNAFGIRIDVDVVPFMTLERTMYKAKRVEDRRKG